MILFRSCPKCATGDLMKTRDAFGEYMECLQCGFVRDIELLPAGAEPFGVLVEFPTLSNDNPLQSA